MMMLRMSIVSLLALICLSSVVLASPSSSFSRIRSIDRYFRLVLDTNEDGLVSRAEYNDYLEKLDPASYPSLPFSFTNIRHSELDLNRDENVSFEELCLSLNVCAPAQLEPETLKWILSANLTEPVQVHLAATPTPAVMLINWAQNVTDTSSGTVHYGTQSGSYPFSAVASEHTYTVYLSVFSYTSMPLFSANMTGLIPNTKYYYIIGTPLGGYSEEMSFTSLPDPTLTPQQQVTTRMITYGDQGTVLPMGATVCKWVEAENAVNPFGVLLHLGDLAYAGTSHKIGEYEPTWDVWMEQISPLASAMPYMTSVGNHEDFFNFASYEARFNMPGAASGGNGSFWFSFDQGAVHVTSFSTESPYDIGSTQWNWIEQDFKNARANPNTKWLILSGHRPLYGSDNDEYETHIPGAPMLLALEGLLNQYQVDLVLTGHTHMYERMWPVNNGTIYNATIPAACPAVKDHELGLENGKADFWAQIDSSVPLQVFDRDAKETAPTYIVQATAGIFQFETVHEPQPVWSNFRLVGTWGYGVLSVSTTSSGCSTLLYQFKTANQQVIDQFALVKQVGKDAVSEQVTIALE